MVAEVEISIWGGCIRSYRDTFILLPVSIIEAKDIFVHHETEYINYHFRRRIRCQELFTISIYPLLYSAESGFSADGGVILINVEGCKFILGVEGGGCY